MSDKTDYHRGYTPELPAQGAGTVTSVALNMPAQFTVTGSPVTSAGTLNASWVSQTQRLFLASPNSGSGTPSFRAILATDLPELSQYQPRSTVLSDLAFGSGNIAFSNASLFRRTYTLPNVNATILTDNSPVTVAQGGTGLTSLTTGNYLRAASSSTLEQRTPAQVRADIGAGTGNGTVTSVALSPPTGMSVTGSPITGSGTLNLNWGTFSGSRFLASPTAAFGAPSFRTIVAGDLPWLGTAATHNVPASGDAASNEVVLGNDSRLGGGGGSPPGSNTQVIFNNAGAFGASPNMTFDGTLFKAAQAQARLAEYVFNANTSLTSATVPELNRVIKKTATGNYTYTIFNTLGANGDTITIVNAAGTGNITVTGSGVNLYINGTLTSSYVIGPRRIHTFYRMAANQWLG